VYEAEDGAIDHVGLEATHAGFSGWGYVAGWTADKQAVEFLIPSAVAMDRSMTFAYAAGAGNAARSLSVNGALVSAALAFPATASWDAWGHVSTSAHLVAGTNVVRLAYDGAAGSAGAINLDRLTLAP
jgi:hypothetical protein